MNGRGHDRPAEGATMRSTIPSRDCHVVHFATFVALALLMLLIAPGQAQTFTVLHNFSGGMDGANPPDGLTMDAAGNLYGVASGGGQRVSGCQDNEGTYGCGTVFEMKPFGSSWLFTPLYQFPGGDDNRNPTLGVVIGPDGALYGAAHKGAFRLTPPPTFCNAWFCSWQSTIFHRFAGHPNADPPSSRLIFDSAGNIYGVSYFGGPYNGGSVFQLSHRSGG
jgi:hypothetical protein